MRDETTGHSSVGNSTAERSGSPGPDEGASDLQVLRLRADCEGQTAALEPGEFVPDDRDAWERAIVEADAKYGKGNWSWHVR